MEKENRITILLSTYNGSKFLREQLDSIFGQSGVQIKLIVRDDGSSKDNTIGILNEYQHLYPDMMIVHNDQNIGAEKSFNELCRYALHESLTDFYAFCDQDDVWDSDKLKIAIDCLSPLNGDVPNLYFSNLRMVDSKLNLIGNFYEKGEVQTSKKFALLQIFTYGCTCVFNRKALEYYCMVDNNTYHDNWVYSICAFCGNTIYDPIGHIAYRQHETNLSLHKGSGFKYNITKIIVLIKTQSKRTFETLSLQLLKLNASISVDDRKFINMVAYYRKNIKYKFYLLFGLPSTGNVLKDLSLRYRIIFNKL